MDRGLFIEQYHLVVPRIHRSVDTEIGQACLSDQKGIARQFNTHDPKYQANDGPSYQRRGTSATDDALVGGSVWTDSRLFVMARALIGISEMKMAWAPT